jgi:hypothetical protein
MPVGPLSSTMSTGIFITRPLNFLMISMISITQDWPWGALAQADFSLWEQALARGLREQVQPRDFCTLGVSWVDGSVSGNGGTFEWVDSGKGSLPRM